MNKAYLSRVAITLLSINKTLLVIALILMALCRIALCDVGWVKISKNAYEGVRNKKIRVMVVDTGIDKDRYPLLPYLKLNPHENVEDEHGHGTHTASIVIHGNMNGFLNEKKPLESVCKEVELYVCKYYHKSERLYGSNMENTAKCFQRAVDEKMDYVNYSAGGYEFYEKEYVAVKNMSKHGIILIAAAGNDSSDLTTSPYYPAAYAQNNRVNDILYKKLNNVIPVGNLKIEGNKLTKNYSSNYGIKGMAWEVGTEIYSTMPREKGYYGLMTGTSEASAMHLHRMLMKQCKALHKGE